MFAACGWPAEELRAVVRRLHAAGKVTWFHLEGRRWYAVGCSTRKSGVRKCK
jgi:hypothetical protein